MFFFIRPQKFCGCIILMHCHRLPIDCRQNDFRAISWQILLSFEHSDPWPWIEVWIIDFRYFSLEGTFEMNSLRKCISEKCNYYCFDIKQPKSQIKFFKLFGGYFFLKRDLIGAQIMKFRIFGSQVSKIQWVHHITVSNNMQCLHLLLKCVFPFLTSGSRIML